MRLHRFLLLGLLLLSGCVPFLFDDSCGPTTRTRTVGAEVRDAAGAMVGYTQASLQEDRDDPGVRTLTVILMGPAYANPGPLSRHIQRVRLLAADGTPLRDFAFRHANEHEIIWIDQENVASAAEFDRLKRLFAAREAVLEIESDVPGLERLRVPLRLLEEGRWSRASCS